MKNYNKSIVQIIYKSFKSKNNKILDFGAGIGTLSIIYEKVSGIKPLCVELDPINRKSLRDQGFKAFKTIKDSKINFDAIFSSNVLEHIIDDQKAIFDIYENLNKNGLLFLFLPAFEILYSDMDRKVGHHRRYDMSDLKKKNRKRKFENL